MINLKRILLASDFSKTAGDALQYARELANRFNAELHVLHVMDDVYSRVPDFGMGLDLPSFVEDLPALRKQREQEAVRYLSEQTKAAGEYKVPVVMATCFGAPFLEIINYSKQHNIDLIVMGTHGRTGLGHTVLGSVAEKVVRKSRCPVLTIRPLKQKADADA